MWVRRMLCILLCQRGVILPGRGRDTRLIGPPVSYPISKTEKIPREIRDRKWMGFERYDVNQCLRKMKGMTDPSVARYMEICHCLIFDQMLMYFLLNLGVEQENRKFGIDPNTC